MLGIIRSYKLIKKNYYRVYLQYTRNLRTLKQKSTLKKKRKYLTFSKNAVKILDKTSGQSSYVFETSKGLLLSSEAAKLKIGGVLICKLR